MGFYKSQLTDSPFIENRVQLRGGRGVLLARPRAGHVIAKTAAVGEGWKPEHHISEYCIDDSSESAKQSLTGGWDFADALKWAADRIPVDFDHFAPNEDFHLEWFIEHDRSILTDLMEFGRRSGGFDISLPAANSDG